MPKTQGKIGWVKINLLKQIKVFFHWLHFLRVPWLHIKVSLPQK